jgi:radical SAM enzyme (TIGR01210 family)
LVEQEPAGSGEVVSVATIFLTNRECPWRCLMCDLWRNTLLETVPVGAIPAQIKYALETLAENRPNSEAGLGGLRIAQQIKLYNSGSFFDPRAIPIVDYEAIAQLVGGFERVIVECHPALVNDSCLHFRDVLLKHAGNRSADSKLPRLEIAMGLETVHPEVLPRLNKRMTLGQFSKAAEFLSSNEIDLRAFILVKPPFLNESEGLYWAERSLDFAFQVKAAVASLIPTRLGNGALDALAEQGEFSPPKLSTLERAFSYGLSLGRGRVLADLWDLQKFADCPACFQRRADRLREMNLRQIELPPVDCGTCGAPHGL